MQRYTIGLIFLLIAGCSPKSNGSSLEWKFVKSPLSHRCYEMAYYAFNTRYGLMAMSEIPCDKTRTD